MASPEAAAAGGRLKATWRPERARVLEHRQGGPDWYKLTLAAPYVAQNARAGHFIELAVLPAGHGGWDPLLKRPFSVCQIRPEAGVVTVIYRAGPGRGTRALSRVAPGQELDLLGPLGWSFPDPARGRGTLALVGGGVGIPPMVAAAEWAAAAGRPAVALVGARSADGLCAVDELEHALGGAPLTVCTDDGSRGRRGLVTEPLAELLARGAVGEVWACGPEPMLAAVQRLCRQHGVPAWLSLERYMACGFGACMSCTVARPGRQGYERYARCCVDGPVFPAEEVEL